MCPEIPARAQAVGAEFASGSGRCWVPSVDGGHVPAVPRKDNLQPAGRETGNGGTASPENCDKPAREKAARVGGCRSG